VYKPFPPNPPDLNGPQDAALRQEEFGDLSQAADQFDAAREYYAIALNRSAPEDRAVRARLLAKLAECDHRQGLYDEALGRLGEARALARPLKDARLNGVLASRLARAHVAAGRYRPGTRYARTAFRYLRSTNEHVELGVIEQTLGIAALRTGDYPSALDAFTGSLASFRRVEDLSHMAGAHSNLGLVYKNTGQWREATRSFEQALRLAEKVGDYFYAAYYAQNLGLMRYRLGELDLASECFRRALQIEIEINDRLAEARTRLAMGRLDARRRVFASAETDATATFQIPGAAI
jgi:tetratricopeptide (TPR) repeat protein